MVLDLLPNHSYLVAFSWVGGGGMKLQIMSKSTLYYPNYMYLPKRVQKFWVF